MARHSSALKAHRQNVKRREHNRQFRTELRHALKKVRTAIDGGQLDEARTLLGEVFSLVDKLAGKGIIHHNTAGRYKSRIAKKLTKKQAAA